MDLSIIIVNWNSKDFLRKCLASVERETRRLEYEVVVIDAGSFDGCGEMLGKNFPRVRFIQSDRNLGFVRANNTAFEATTGSTVLFLNPDTEITGAAIQIMYEKLHSLPLAGAVGCKLLNADGTVQTSCIQALPTILNQLLDSEFLRARWPESSLWGMAPLFRGDRQPHVVEMISGACVMLKRDVFEKIGRFSEDYFMYAEDVDLGYKVARAGYKNYYVPEATVIHHGGGSSRQVPGRRTILLMRESVCRFLRKVHGNAYGWRYRLAMMGLAVFRLCLVAPAFVLCMFDSSKIDRCRAYLRKWGWTFMWAAGLSHWT